MCTTDVLIVFMTLLMFALDFTLFAVLGMLTHAFPSKHVEEERHWLEFCLNRNHCVKATMVGLCQEVGIEHFCIVLVNLQWLGSQV